MLKVKPKADLAMIASEVAKAMFQENIADAEKATGLVLARRRMELEQSLKDRVVSMASQFIDLLKQAEEQRQKQE